MPRRRRPCLALAALTLASLAACGPDGPAPTQNAIPAPAAGAAAPAPTDLVGYDLRRLRPRADEPLDAMFERLRGQALGEGKRTMVLFSADWCEPCKRLDAELGNRQPAATIGDVRIFELKEEDWQAAARMDEFNQLRRRWHDKTGSYPLFILLDAAGARIEEMKDAIDRLEAAGVEPTLATWLAEARPAAKG